MTPTIGVPTETKDGERRIVLDPSAVAMLAAAGLEVRVQRGAGVGAGFSDDEYEDAGARSSFPIPTMPGRRTSWSK